MLTRALFDFLRELKDNNDRDWFKANKRRYEQDVKEPVLAFIEAAEERLEDITTQFEGSLFRIYRDTRFAADKSPYKTHAGAHFRHRQGKDAHAPGFYLHLQPGEVFMAAGLWHPDPPALAAVRDALQAWPQRWREATQGLELTGDTLKRAPKGVDPDHPLIVDLKRKDFAAYRKLSEAEATAPDFVDRFADGCRELAPLTRFLTEAVRLPF